jgi:hypothetical protein
MSSSVRVSLDRTCISYIVFVSYLHRNQNGRTSAPSIFECKYFLPELPNSPTMCPSAPWLLRMYLYVHRPSRPTGPRACILPVAIPTCKRMSYARQVISEDDAPQYRNRSGSHLRSAWMRSQMCLPSQHPRTTCAHCLGSRSRCSPCGVSRAHSRVRSRHPGRSPLSRSAPVTGAPYHTSPARRA